MKRRGALVGQRLQALDQLRRGDRQVGHHERHVERQALALEVDHDVLDRQAGRLLEALDRSRRSQPEDVAGSVETMISSIGCARDRRPWRR